MKVYLVWRLEQYEAPWLAGIYSTRELARDAAEQLVNDEGEYADFVSYRIKEREVL